MPRRFIRFVKFNLTCVAGIGFSVLLLNGQVYWLHINLYLANLIAIVLVSVWNFFLNLRFGRNTSIRQLPRKNPAAPSPADVD